MKVEGTVYKEKEGDGEARQGKEAGRDERKGYSRNGGQDGGGKS